MSSSPSPQFTPHSRHAQAANKNIHIVSGKTMLALLAGFGLLGGIIWWVVPLYHQAMGHEAHHQVLWCTTTDILGTDAAEIRGQGFSAVNRTAPGYSRLGDEPRHRVQCFSKDYGQHRPSYRQIDRSYEYRMISTYYAAPEDVVASPRDDSLDP